MVLRLPVVSSVIILELLMMSFYIHIGLTTGFSGWRLDEREFPEKETRPRRGVDELVPDLNSITTNSTFLEDVPNYPEELVRKILEKEGSKYAAFFEKYNDEEEAAGQRSARSVRNSSCQSESKVVYPKAAKSKDGIWKFIATDAKGYLQPVFVEHCTSRMNPCSAEEDSNEILTECAQIYKYETMLYFDKFGKNIDKFLMPSACVCITKRK